ncbi:MAG TPA: DUF4446 family protein [Patescibacteria group bacterium]|nr:DUF4446 family protein [Patescibacteria group bacterium]
MRTPSGSWVGPEDSIGRVADARIGRRRGFGARIGPEDPARLGPPGASAAADPTRRNRAIDLNALVEPVIGTALVALVLAILALILLTLVQARRIGRLRARLDLLTRGADDADLGAVLDAHLDKVFAVARELDDLSARSAVLEAAGRRAIQRVGLVRFNPFDDTGGNQSFAMALADAAGNGFILSSLHSRTGTRVYAKAITDGRSDAALSDEEQAALRIALIGQA